MLLTYRVSECEVDEFELYIYIFLCMCAFLYCIRYAARMKGN